ncbi:MAG TPA: prepilin-type N-terminal cleavage/methylation domain-containing protein [Gemmatimonadaceae bacterium]|nr:prepilin-type N-terminal cleavage/methylation domain-containing protein [Gemmatimonadaceae bacterium]
MRRRRGMTLMELVIGLAITGMMAAAGAGAFSSIIAHRRIIRDASVDTERAAAFREMLETWINAGTVQIQRGGGPRGLTRGVGAALPTGGRGGITSNTAAVSAATAIGDEITFTTTALNPAFTANARIRLYIDGDDNTPERGLTMEYQPNLQQPLVRRMLDSTIDTLKVEYLDPRTDKWIRASEAATIATQTAVRVTLLPGEKHTIPAILQVPMIFMIGAQNGRRASTFP